MLCAPHSTAWFAHIRDPPAGDVIYTGTPGTIKAMKLGDLVARLLEGGGAAAW